MNKKLFGLIITLLVLWNIILTITIAKEYTERTTSTTINEINVDGFSTDLTQVVSKTKSSAVSVETSETTLSGFVFDKKGNSVYIVTCYHGIVDQTSIKVMFDSGLSLEAKEIGHDIYSDIAVLEVNSGLEVNKVTIGDNTLVKNGEFLICIGTPNSTEYANSSELCMVSSPLRTISNSIISEEAKYEYYIDLIQISGNISNGYSGSPLFNMNGEIVGMVSSNSDNSVFATTINEMKIIVNKIINDIDANKLHLGICGEFVSSIENYEKNNYNLPLNITSGYYITNVRPVSVMSIIGVKIGDVITNINGVNIIDQHDLLEIEYSEPNQLTIEVIRDGESLSLTGSISHD